MEETMYEDEGISIGELVSIIIKHFKIFLLVFCLIVTASLLYIGINDRTYTATTNLFVESLRNLTNWSGSRSDVRDINRELKMLERDATVRSALESMDLHSYKRKDGSDYSNLLTDSNKFKALQKSLETSVTKDTNTVVLSVTHTNPLFAQDFLQAVVDSFKNALWEYSKDELALEHQSLIVQKQETEAILFLAKEQISALYEDTEILALQANRGNYQKVLSLVQLHLSKARAVVNEESSIQQFEEVLQNIPGLSSAIQTYSDVYRTYIHEEISFFLIAGGNEDQKQRTRSYELDQKLRDIEASVYDLLITHGMDEATSQSTMLQLVNTIRYSILIGYETEYLAKLQSLTVLQQEYSELQATVSRENSSSIQIDNKLRNLDLYVSSDISPLYVIDPVRLNSEQGESNNLLILAVGVLLGAALALLSTLLFEYLSDSIDDERVLCRILGKKAPLLAQIPKGLPAKESEVELIDHPTSNASATYQQLAGVFLYSGKKKAYTLTSLGYGEGTTYTAINIALAVVQCGKTALLINTKHEDIHYQRIFSKLSKHAGLSSVVRIQEYEQAETCKAPMKDEQLRLVSINTSSNELTQQLHGKQFQEYIKKAEEIFDIVLIDGPTFNSSANLLAIAKVTDGIILNIRTYIGSRKRLATLLQTLDLCKTHLDGVILNNYCGKPTFSQKREVLRHNQAMKVVMNEVERKQTKNLTMKMSSR